MKLTEADKDALSVMPNDWFFAQDLPYPRVKRSDYRCDRLVKAGLLESRVVESAFCLKRQYRLAEQEAKTREEG